MNWQQKLDQKIKINGNDYVILDMINWENGNEFYDKTWYWYYENRSFKKREISQGEFENYCTCNTISEFLHEHDLTVILNKEFQEYVYEIKKELIRIEF